MLNIRQNKAKGNNRHEEDHYIWKRAYVFQQEDTAMLTVYVLNIKQRFSKLWEETENFRRRFKNIWLIDRSNKKTRRGNMWATDSYPCTQLVDCEQTLFKPTVNNYRSNHETRLKENLKNYYRTDNVLWPQCN